MVVAQNKSYYIKKKKSHFDMDKSSDLIYQLIFAMMLNDSLFTAYVSIRHALFACTTHVT